MLLNAISQSDPISALAVAGLYASAPILADAQFYARSGASDNVKKAKQVIADKAIFRSLHEANTASEYTPQYLPIPKKIVSFDAKVDVILEDRNEDTQSELAQETYNQAESAGFTLQEAFFEGDNDDDAESFDGMRELATLYGTVRTVDVTLALGNSDAKRVAMQLAVEEFKKAAATVRGGATHAYMNEYMQIRWLSIAKELGYYRQDKDELGNIVDKLGNIILRSAGQKEDGSYLLPFTEEGNSTSIFFTRWGERKDLSVLTSVGVKGRYTGQVSNNYINNVNCDMALILQNGTALYQYQGWKLGY